LSCITHCIVPPRLSRRDAPRVPFALVPLQRDPA
jgi:hypothetical protein